MNKACLFIFSVLLLSTGSDASVVRGVTKNQHDLRLGFADIAATQVGDPANRVITTSDRYGSYSLDLPAGSWLIEIDPDQLEEWGYQALEVPLEVTDELVVIQDLVPDPVDPPIVPVVDLLAVTPEGFTLQIIGGGGRVFQVERSSDMKTWIAMNAFPTAKGTVIYSSNFNWPDPAPAYWRVVVVD